MNKNLFFTVFATLALGGILASCGDKQSDMPEEAAEGAHKNHVSMESPSTKIAKLEDGKTAIFDLQTMENHANMMKQMDMSMKHDSDSTHAILLTLKDGDGELIKAKEVTMTITPENGNAMTKKATIMEGGEMLHYAVGVELPEKGALSVKAEFPEKDGSSKMEEAAAKFQLPLP